MGLTVIDRVTDNIKGELDENNGLISAIYKKEKTETDMSLEVSIYLNSDVEVRVGDSLVLQDEVGKLREFLVQDIEELDGDIGDLVCVPSYLEDLGLSEPKIVNESLTGKQLLNEVIKGTQWKLGEVIDLDFKIIKEEDDRNEGEEKSYVRALEVIENITQDKNVYTDYEIKIVSGKAPERLINIYISKLVKNGKEVERGKDLTSLKRRESIADIITAVKVIGNKTYKDKDADGNEVEVKEDVVISLVNDEVQNKIGKTKNYRWDILEVDTDDEELLKRAGRNHLKDKARIQESFEVDVVELGKYFEHESVRYGDYVIIKDYNYNPVLIVEGEIIGVEIDLVNEWNKKYVIGEMVSFKSELDSLRELLERSFVKIRNNVDTQNELKRRLISITGEGFDEKEGEGFVYHNELTAEMIRGKGSFINHFNYEELLRAEAVSRENAEKFNSAHGGRLNNSYPLMSIFTNRDLKPYWIYTLRFKVKDAVNLIMEGEVSEEKGFRVVGLSVNGEDRREKIEVEGLIGKLDEEWFVELELKENDEVELCVVLGKKVQVEGIRMYTREPLKRVLFEGLILYNGTADYGTKDLVTGNTVVGFTKEEREGNDFTIERERPVSTVYRFPWHSKNLEIGSIILKNDGVLGQFYTIEADEVILEPYLDTNNNTIVKDRERYVGLKDDTQVVDALIEVENEVANRYLRNENVWSLFGSRLGDATEKEKASKVENYIIRKLRKVVYVESGTDKRVIIESDAAELGGGLTRIHLKNLRVYRGVAPIGIVREGDKSLDDKEGRDLTTELGRLHARIDDKADAIHEHDISDIRELDSKLSSIEERLTKQETNEEEIVVDISSVTGLEEALSLKADIQHTHTQDYIEGLVSRLEGLEVRIRGLENK